MVAFCAHRRSNLNRGQAMSLASPTLRGPWTKTEVHAFLTDARIPMRVAANTPSGYPVVVSLWFLAEGDELFAAVHRSARIAKRLVADGRCAFEIAPNEPPYRGVRGQAMATLHHDGARSLLERLLERYLGSIDSSLGRFLLGRADDEFVVRLRPVRISSWDYGDRMKDAISP